MSLVTLGLGPTTAPIRILMRAYHTEVPIGYVYWEVEEVPDPLGLLAPFPAVDLLDIVIAYEYPQEVSA
jgi:hypothetical protein